jgi:PAS domain S-box-containing protein
VFDHVIEAMVDAVLVVDHEGRVTVANTAAAVISGYTRDELHGMPIAMLLVDDGSGLRTIVRRRIEEGDVLRREESWLVAKSGDRIPVSVTGSAVLGEGGELQGIVLVARDVRELRQLLADKESEIARRRAAEEELLAAKASIEEQLEDSRKMVRLLERRATLGTLAGGVGHELRNIAQFQISAVEELAAALASGDDLDQIARAILPELGRVGDHITEHGRRLMQLARPGPGDIAPLDLAELVRGVVTMLRGAGKLRRIQVQLVFAEPTLQVTVNRTNIEQVFVNLLLNAVDAIGESSGTIMIEARASADATRVECAVTDTGAGIPEDQLSRIFEPFFTTKPEDKGTGLGLSVARQVVESYGGVLGARSTVGVGTTFTFDLPR